MSYGRQRAREEFLVTMHREGVPTDVSRKIMRHATTLHRIAEAECNGTFPANHDWSAADEDRPCPCLQCKADRSATQSIRNLTKPYGVEPIFSGDPRGAVVKLKVTSGKTDDWGREGICVP